MESIDTGYLLELQFMLEASIDVQFQAWMAITFAVIVASYSSRDTLKSGLRVILAIAYLLAAYTLFARWRTESSRIIDMILPLLASRGVASEIQFYAGIARQITYALGTLIATISIFYFSVEKPKFPQKERFKNGIVLANSK